MSPGKRVVSDEMKAWMCHCANSSRDTADEMARQFGGCDDPMYPFAGPQIFTDWVDFTQRVCRPLVEADGEDEVAIQAAMLHYRKMSPYFICVSLVMAVNRIEALEADVAALEARDA